MKLGTKILLAVLLSCGMMIGITYLGSLYILKTSYANLEIKKAAANMNTVNLAIHTLIENNDSNVLNWAHWDDMSNFVGAKPLDQKFIDVNFIPATVSMYNIDMALVYDTAGNLVFGTAYSPDHAQYAPLEKETKLLFQPGGELSALVRLPENDNDIKGLILTKQGILVFSSRNIYKTDAKPPSHGTLIFANYINDKSWELLRTSTKLDVLIYPISEIKNNPIVSNQLPILINNSINNVIVNDKLMHVYGLVKDIYGKPIAVTQISMPRGINLLGIKTIHYFNVSFLMSSIILILLLYYFLRTILINRLEKIYEGIKSISKTKDLSIRISEKGSDELGSVADEINTLLTIIESIEGLLSGIINSMPSILIIIDKNMKVTNLNHLAEKELGTTIEKSQGKTLFDLLPFMTDYKNILEESIHKKSTHEIEKIIYVDKNMTRYFNSIIYPLIRSGQENLAIRLDDITEHVKVEQRLAQTDKLASIGVLTAGVAHEINNPINFVASAIVPLKRNIEDILHLLNKYGEINTVDDLKNMSPEIEKIKADIDCDYLKKETNELISGMKEGAARTATIIKDLKLFTRLDETGMKKSNIHHGLDSTLSLLSHNLTHRITIKKNYGNIPEIDCYPGKLNQVFMNLIANAIDSIHDKGEITIKTEQKEGKIRISIKDTGSGISEENMTKIFDPFFTTKDVGKGTGLGLAITSSIIKEHNGFIEVKSELGKGAEFIIIL